MTSQNHSDVSEQKGLPDMILMEVPIPSPIWKVLVQSGWKMVDVKDHKALLTREFIQA